MGENKGTSSWRAVAAAVVILAAGAGAYFALGGRVGKRADIAPPDDALRFRRTDPKLIEYEEVAGIDTGMKDPRGLATDGNDQVYVVGDMAVHVFSPLGAKLREFPTSDRGTSLACFSVPKRYTAVHGPAVIVFVATRNGFEFFDPDGSSSLQVRLPDANSMISSIAVGESGVFLADDNRAEILRFAWDGNVLARIGRRGDPNQAILLRSPHFDVALGPDGLLWITNPGRLRVEAYTLDGDREVSWGVPTMDIVGFCDCCNPKDIAFLPDGGIVTSEKGIPRVKVYERDGKLRCVVAGAESFDTGVHYLDLAVDRAGRVLVLDPVQKKVRIFVRKDEKLTTETQRSQR
jgi:hypothetical protein